MYPVKRGTYVRSNTAGGVRFLPCEKYDESVWYFDAYSGATSWLPKTTGKYKIEMSGGKSGNASLTWTYLSSYSHSGANGRKVTFTLKINKLDAIPIQIGQNTSDRSIDGSISVQTVTSDDAGASSFINIRSPGGTGAWSKASMTEVGWWNTDGANGETPSAPTKDEIIASLPEGVEFVDEAYDGSGTSDHGYISISKIEENLVS